MQRKRNKWRGESALVPDNQWARVNQVVQEEAGRARVAATFLPLYGPLPPDTDFIRKESIPWADEEKKPLGILKIEEPSHAPVGDARSESGITQRTDGRPRVEQRSYAVPPRR